MKLGQILSVAIEELKRKVNLCEAVIDEVQDKPQEIGVKAKLPFPDSLDDLGFCFVVGRHTLFIGRAGGRFSG